MSFFRLNLLLTYACLHIFALWSCQPDTPSTTTSKTFFSVPDFVADQTQFLQQQKTQLDKQLHINQQKEQQHIVQPNWEKELALFANTDINKAAWRDSYQKDSNFVVQDSLWHIDYTARDPHLRTQKISIQRHQQNLHSLSIHNQVNNLFYSLDECLAYQPNKGYQIVSVQNIVLLKADTLRLDAQFVK
jgi:hypothetical protein